MPTLRGSALPSTRTEKQFQLGAAPETNAIRTRIALTQEEQNLLTVINNVLVGRANLNLAPGREPARPIDFGIIVSGAVILVFEGGVMRLRPVLMTAILASIGLVPAAISTGIGSDTQKPLAIVIIAGLVSAAILTLGVLPVLYSLAARRVSVSVPAQALPTETSH